MKGKKAGGPMRGTYAEDSKPSMVYAGAGSNVVKEASKYKRGGKVKHVGMHGDKAADRLDRPKRKSGGKVGGGSDMRPFSSAHNVKTPAGRDVQSGES